MTRRRGEREIMRISNFEMRIAENNIRTSGHQKISGQSGREGDRETGRQGDKETRRWGYRDIWCQA
jgi:hypothetical protein